MIWINHREMRRLPVNGQEVWYFLPEMGVFRGKFVIDKSPGGRETHEKWGVSLNLFVCSEVCGVVDSDDVLFWMPYEKGSERPNAPVIQEQVRYVDGVIKVMEVAK